VQEEKEREEARGLSRAGEKTLRPAAEEESQGTYREVQAVEQAEEQVMRAYRFALPFGSTRTRVCSVFLGALAASVLFGALATTSPAIAAQPWWHLSSSARPAQIAPGGEGTIVVEAENVGNAPSSGAVHLSAAMPEGVSIQSVSFTAYSLTEVDLGPEGPLGFLELCKVTTSTVTCETSPSQEIVEHVVPYENLEIIVRVKADSNASSGTMAASVSGGGASSQSIDRQILIDSASVPFGIEDFSMVPETEGGSVDTQAGDHPYQLTTTLNLNQTSDLTRPPALARNLAFKLPPGLIGNTTAIAECSDLDFRHVLNGGTVNLCPESTAIGVALVVIDEPTHLGLKTYAIPVFNLAPGQGEPARFGFEFAGAPVTLDTSLRTGDDYGVTVNVNNLTELTNVISSTVTIWGVPGSVTHDESRGWACVVNGGWAAGSGQTCTPTSETQPPPFLATPTSCKTAFSPVAEMTAWPTKAAPSGPQANPFTYSLVDGLGRPTTMTGCNRLSFNPSIEVAPDTQAGSSPAGLTTNIHVPQEQNENAGGLVSSDIKAVNLTLPEGLTINPSGADGLEACSEAQIGYLPGASNPPEDLHFTPDIGAPFCPEASKVGTATITTPILKNPLEGYVYVATQDANPFHSLIAMYIVAEEPVSGVRVKLPGKVSLSSTGQITASFTNTPQAPFENAVVKFFGGARAALSTPPGCASYAATASFSPWSENAAVSSQSQFAINSGPGGAPCTLVRPFNPTLSAGTSVPRAGAFSQMVTTVAREDGNQDLQTVQLRTPPGLSGVLTGVPLCGEAQANAGTCPSGSLIGHTAVSAGLGSDPFTAPIGQVFLTEGYKGSPFGLSIVNPAKAGPFDLGNVVVRAKIDIDPHTAVLTVTTDPIPHILQGIPLQIKRTTVTIDRPGFTFNPTNCQQLSVTGTIGGTEGASVNVANAFQASNCANLKFTPSFSVSVTGNTSKAKGAGLSVKLTYPKGALGSQANIGRVKVSLPKQLPSRLTTLQKACTAEVFNPNPSNCPAASRVGQAKVLTPLLPVALTGPAYFVSHGGEAFPDLTIVLKGYGITVDLVGSTQIKNGVTTTTFKAPPDVPFSSFELTLPQGQFSALTANAKLCQSKLVMPTEFVGQNGAEIRRNTNIAVTGCAKALTRPQKLARALRACHKRKKHTARASCEQQARKQFGAKKKHKK
jgi:hypothetical protein